MTQAKFLIEAQPIIDMNPVEKENLSILIKNEKFEAILKFLLKFRKK